MLVEIIKLLGIKSLKLPFEIFKIIYSVHGFLWDRWLLIYICTWKLMNKTFWKCICNREINWYSWIRYIWKLKIHFLLSKGRHKMVQSMGLDVWYQVIMGLCHRNWISWMQNELTWTLAIYDINSVIINNTEKIIEKHVTLRNDQ